MFLILELRTTWKNFCRNLQGTFPYDYHQNLSVFQAIDTRDALAKSIYASLFDWLVEQINKSLAVGKRRTGRSISILDIYGFESFDV